MLADSLVLPFLPDGREIAKFLKLQNIRQFKKNYYENNKPTIRSYFVHNLL
jgi:hypothetical protein